MTEKKRRSYHIHTQKSFLVVYLTFQSLFIRWSASLTHSHLGDNKPPLYKASLATAPAEHRSSQTLVKCHKRAMLGKCKAPRQDPPWFEWHPGRTLAVGRNQSHILQTPPLPPDKPLPQVRGRKPHRIGRTVRM